VVTDANKNLVSRGIKNNTSVSAIGWTASDTSLVTVNTLAFWNGAYSGNSSNISKLGTISTGTWQGTTIGVSYGGTGTNSAPTAYGVIYAASTSAYASTAAGIAGSPFIGAGSAAPKWYDGLSLTGLGTDASPYNATFSNTVTIGGKLTLNGA